MVGQTISHYEVLEELGRGGMGAVYKARDTVLGRILALKILRADVANPTRERRFVQEARTASSLNHPSIVTIYEIFHVDESPCIAMEYITGVTLERLLETGPVDLRKGLDWAIALADALARAHDAGIVHRDVKPSNIMITDGGFVKILDFGLAKLTEISEQSDPGEALTLDGRIVGSPPYLSPEQAKGEKIDARSDIFSLGTVLYELFTGKRPFERPSNVEMLSAVVRDEPKKLRSVARELPPRLGKIIAQCLEKKVERRYQSMDRVKDDLDDLRQTVTLTRLATHRAPPSWWQPWKLAVAGGVLLVIAAAAGFWWSSSRTEPDRVAVVTRITSDDGLTTDPAVSPDGKFLAYASDRGGETLDIWIQPLGSDEPVRLTTHPAEDREPAFSPDGSRVAFRSHRDGGGVYVTSILGGQEHLIAHHGRRPRFSPDGKWIAYWTGLSTGDPTSPGSNKIFVVPSTGGTARQLVPEFDSAWYPVWAPDGQRILFLAASPTTQTSADAGLNASNRPLDRVDWWVTGLDGRPPVKTGVLPMLNKQGLSVWANAGAGIAPEFWMKDGNRVLFSASLGAIETFRDTVNLWSVALTRNEAVAGPARQITSGTAVQSRPTVTSAGDIIFASADVRTGIWMLPLKANEGTVEGELRPLTRGAAFHGQPAVALNGSKVVYFSTKSGNMDIWIQDLQTGRESRLTSTGVSESSPQISSDGSTVYYSAYGKREAYLMSAGGGEATKICDDCGTWSVSHDGLKILYWHSTAKPVVSIGMLKLPEGRKLELISHPEYSLYQPHFSPDDRWLTFLAKTGQDRMRIYVVPYRGATRIDVDSWIPVTAGETLDDKPRWSPDGTLLYFISERDGFRCIWAQRLDPSTKRPVGEPFNVSHLHMSRRSLMNVGLGPLEISMASNALVFNLGEITGNIWRVSRD